MNNTQCDLWVCTDCAMLIANGELPSEMSEDELNAYVARIDENWSSDWHIALGMNGLQHDATGCECQQSGEIDCFATHETFSWRVCDYCRRPNNAGSREAATAWR